MRRTAASAKREVILPFFALSCLGTGQKHDISSEICPVPESERCLNDERAACLSEYKVDKRVYLKITSADRVLQFATLKFCKKLCFITKKLREFS